MKEPLVEAAYPHDPYRHGKNVHRFPGNTRVAISADTAKELIDAAVQHAVAVHGHTDRPELRE